MLKTINYTKKHYRGNISIWSVFSIVIINNNDNNFGVKHK